MKKIQRSIHPDDEPFNKNIDKSGKETAEFAAVVISKEITDADMGNMLFCSYLKRNIEEGLCYDIQMISKGYVLPSVLPDIGIDKSKSINACKTCKHKMCGGT